MVVFRSAKERPLAERKATIETHQTDPRHPVLLAAIGTAELHIGAQLHAQIVQAPDSPTPLGTFCVALINRIEMNVTCNATMLCG
jgi:hypothetical protein